MTLEEMVAVIGVHWQWISDWEGADVSNADSGNVNHPDPRIRILRHWIVRIPELMEKVWKNFLK